MKLRGSDELSGTEKKLFHRNIARRSFMHLGKTTVFKPCKTRASQLQNGYLWGLCWISAVFCCFSCSRQKKELEHRKDPVSESADKRGVEKKRVLLLVIEGLSGKHMEEVLAFELAATPPRRLKVDLQGSSEGRKRENRKTSAYDENRHEGFAPVSESGRFSTQNLVLDIKHDYRTIQTSEDFHEEPEGKTSETAVFLVEQPADSPTDLEPNPKMEMLSQIAPAPDPEPDPDPNPEPVPGPSDKPLPTREPDPDPKLETLSEVDPSERPEPESESEPESEPEPESDPKLETMSEVDPLERPELESEPKPDPDPKDRLQPTRPVGESLPLSSRAKRKRSTVEAVVKSSIKGGETMPGIELVFDRSQCSRELREIENGFSGESRSWSNVTILQPPEPGSGFVTLLTMLTGHDPAAHGVVARRFMRRGSVVRGYKEPLLATSVIRKAREEGLRVITWGVPNVRCGFDRGEDPTLGDLFSVCKPSAGNIGKAMPDLSPWPSAGPPRRRRRPDTARYISLRTPRSCKMDVDGNGFDESRESTVRLWSTGIRLDSNDGALVWLESSNSNPTELAEGQWMEARWVGECGGSPKARRSLCDGADFTVKLLDSNPSTGRSLLYGSGMTRLQTSDSRRCSSLRDAGVVWPAPPDFESYEKGRMDAVTMAEALLFGTMAVGRFVEWLNKESWDLAVVRLDTPRNLAKSLNPPIQRSDLKKEEIFHLYYVWQLSMARFFSIVRDIANIPDSDNTTVIIVGTGGLVSTEIEVGLGGIVQETAPGSRIVENGNTAFVYLDEYSRRSGALDLLRHRMERLRWKGRSVFRKPGGVRKSIDLPRTLKRPEVGDLFLSAACGFRLSGRRVKGDFRLSDKMAAECYDENDERTLGGLIVANSGEEYNMPSKMQASCVAYWLEKHLGLKSANPAGRPGCI